MNIATLKDFPRSNEYCPLFIQECAGFLRRHEHDNCAVMVTNDGRIIATGVAWIDELLFLQRLTFMVQQHYEYVSWWQAPADYVRNFVLDADGANRHQVVNEGAEAYATLAQQALIGIIHDALSKQASDVHLQCRGEEVTVTFRIHGLLQPQGRRNRTFMSEVMAAAFNTQADDHQELFHEHRTCAASFSMPMGEPYGDVRVRAQQSTCQLGYTVTLRVQQAISTEVSSFEALGFNLVAEQYLRSSSKLSDGLIIFAGPTGHGKTTSLAAFNRLFPQSRKVISLEDPVEIIQPNIEQKYIPETATPGSFARMVKIVLREDPDILAISEIRDAESAAAAVTASLTGHLVVSTLHASSPPAVLTRLQDLKVDVNRLLQNQVLKAVIVQRLVPVLCSECSLKSEQHSLAGVRTINPNGCEACAFRGTSGRILLAEVIAYESSTAIHGEASSIQATAITGSLAEQAFKRLLMGEIDFEHALEYVPDFQAYYRRQLKQGNSHA
ncbi:MAG: Flp pilus assembly complex ATPase component TadA [Aliidiomarina sp.]|uniref:GspE/PulE family protein n=1 Tax=Aliidiomarina sp. TaxID=1872439 RepID=UPI0025C173CF|nr:ATPase, T2SS/T4P/T4SS family [Aliidiomarina sp.]MCH8501429.1 Flp pilus assembly complex ATPase component TadA [Aliidiomarina sp.]